MALIGRTLNEGDDPLADLIQPVPKPPKADNVYLVRLDFRTGPGEPRLEADLVEVDAAACRRYCWVGNAVGNRPQRYLTTNVLEYLVGPAPANLLAFLETSAFAGGALHRRVETLVAQFYQDLPDSSRVLDAARFGLTADDLIASVWETTPGKPRDKAREVLKAVAGALRKRVLADLGIKALEAALWTVLLDGEPLAADPDYAALVLEWKQGMAAGDGAKSAKGVCAVCGAADRPVTHDFAQLDFLKYYINDKLGAASGISEDGFRRNFLACGDCFRGLVVAERYARQHLSLGVGQLDFLVLPAFLRDPALSRADLEAWAERLKARIGAFANISRWLESLAGERGLEAELADFLDELPYENVALLNFLFYRKSKSEFRVLGLVKDVAPSRIAHLLRHGNRLANRAAALLGPDRWWLDLTRIYQLIPLAESARAAEFKKLVHVYTALLAGEPLRCSFLVSQFVALAQIYRTGNFRGTNLRPPAAGYEEAETARRMLQANLFLKFLRDEDLLRGGRFLSQPLALEAELLPEDMRAYLAEMAYDGPQAALFLLGYLLNQVGRAQGDAGYGNKPVLEKVNYNGMLWPKVVRLSNLLVDQLRQHDILRYNEGLFAAMKRLLDAHRRGWPLTPEENVFYILSGYAYATRMALKAWAEKQNANKGGADR
ncbi:MAG: type I-B CRISPR-associated protein Cas8b/Csh1 [Bacillota bacterium]